MVNDAFTMTADIPPEEALAVAHAGAGGPWLAAALALDRRLEAVAARPGDATLTRLRLAWWSETVATLGQGPEPVDPDLVRLVPLLAGRPDRVARVEALVGAWDSQVGEGAQFDRHPLARARAALLLGGADEPAAERALAGRALAGVDGEAARESLRAGLASTLAQGVAWSAIARARGVAPAGGRVGAGAGAEAHRLGADRPLRLGGLDPAELKALGRGGVRMMSRLVAVLLGSLLILGGATVWLVSRADSGAPAMEQAIDDWAAEPGEDPLALPGGDRPQGASRLPAAPGASAVTKEERRFARYDRDRDGVIGRDEMLSTRVKAFKTLDTNGDGFLAFEEWSIATAKRFDGADRDRSQTLTPAEFATTAPKGKAKPKCRC